MKLTSKEKKAVRFALIKMGKTNKKQRRLLWEYILHNNLGVGYYDAQQLQKQGFQVLKSLRNWQDQPD